MSIGWIVTSVILAYFSWCFVVADFKTMKRDGLRAGLKAAGSSIIGLAIVAAICVGVMAWSSGGTAATASTETNTAARSNPGDSSFHGYSCTDDCSGHQAGYDWAEEKDITDPDDCPIDPRNSHSFTEGCWAYAGKDGESDDNGDDQ